MATAERPAVDFPKTPPGQLEANPFLDHLRATEPVARVRPPYGADAWLVTRHADVRTVLTDPRFSRAAANSEDVARAMPMLPPPNWIMSMDPPDHTRLRGLVAKAFTAGRVERLRPRIEEIAEGLLDQLVACGPPADLVERFCLPLPITVMCELLGVPASDQADFRTWSDAVLSTNSMSMNEIIEATTQQFQYLTGLVRERRENPTDDLLGALVQARDGEARLSEDELVMLGMTLLSAGYETSSGQLGNFLLLLLTHPDKWHELCERRDLVPTAVEEMLRHVPMMAGAGFARVATEDVELSGTTIRAGEAVLVSEAAANRDAEVFGDDVELDFTRRPNPHLAFGHGVHYCLGAQLARVELQIAITSVLDRLPSLRLAADPETLRWKQGSLTHGVLQLPVTWS